MSINTDDIKKVDDEVIIENYEDEPEKVGFFSKVKSGLKKHGKKVAAVAALGTVGLIGYALGSRNHEDGAEEYDNNVVSLDYSEINDEETDN